MLEMKFRVNDNNTTIYPFRALASANGIWPITRKGMAISAKPRDYHYADAVSYLMIIGENEK